MRIGEELGKLWLTEVPGVLQKRFVWTCYTKILISPAGYIYILEQSLVAMLQPWALISTSSCTGSIMSMVSQSICNMHIYCHVHVHVDVMFAMYTCHVCMSEPT